MKSEFFEKNRDYFYLVFRVIIGFLFILHGIMKWGAIASFSVTNLMFYAGVIEIIGGVFIVLGLFVRTTAVITALEMIVAYFKVHVTKALSPLANGGEAAVLFFAAFLVLIAFGAGRIALDKLLSKKWKEF